MQTYLTDLNKNATLFLTEGDGELSIQEKSMIEVILTVESKTKECAKM